MWTVLAQAIGALPGEPAAKGGEVLVSSLLKELTDSGGDIEFDGGGEVELKGLTGRQRVFSVAT